MGYINSANTLTLNAKLTPTGRQLLVSSNNTLITMFSLGDSDANYNVVPYLTTGQIPTQGGDIGYNASVSNSTTRNIGFKSLLQLDVFGNTKKMVEQQSRQILIESAYNGYTSVSGSNLTLNLINRNSGATDTLVNLFYSFGLPLNSNDDIKYSGTTYLNGGFSDTSLSGLAQDKILVIGIKNSTYGELIDGKTLQITLPTTGGTYNIYSTYQNKGIPLTTEDSNFTDNSQASQEYGNNISFLFSDTIKKPNGGDPSLSWGTGYNTNKPFSNNGKKLFNLQTNSNIAQSADTAIGVAYLDKGFIVITNPTIIDNIGNINTGPITGATISFNSVSTSVSQTITCIAGRGEFGGSTNPTFSGLDTLRISEIGLYDDLGNLIAFGKTDRHITKNINEFLALSIKIDL